MSEKDLILWGVNFTAGFDVPGRKTGENLPGRHCITAWLHGRHFTGHVESRAALLDVVNAVSCGLGEGYDARNVGSVTFFFPDGPFGLEWRDWNGTEKRLNVPKVSALNTNFDDGSPLLSELPVFHFEGQARLVYGLHDGSSEFCRNYQLCTPAEIMADTMAWIEKKRRDLERAQENLNKAIREEADIFMSEKFQEAAAQNTLATLQTTGGMGA